MTTHKNFAAALALLVSAGFAQTLPASAENDEAAAAGYDSENTRAICRGSIEDCLKRSSAGQNTALGGNASILSRQQYTATPAYQQPAYQQPAYQQPAYQQPAYQAPQPAYQAPQQATAYSPAYGAAPGGSQGEIQVLKQQVSQLSGELNRIKTDMAAILQELRRR